jgi:hypothetical protein
LATPRGSALIRAFLLIVIALSLAFSSSFVLRPVSAYITNLRVAPTSLTAVSGTTTETYGFAVSTTYYGCWGVCESTWFGAGGSAPYVTSTSSVTGCSVANYNSFWWGGTCTITVFLNVNDGGVTPPGTYYPVFYVYTYAPSHLTTNITLTVI